MGKPESKANDNDIIDQLSIDKMLLVNLRDRAKRHPYYEIRLSRHELRAIENQINRISEMEKDNNE